MADHGNFGFGGNQRSYSFPFAGAGRIAVGTSAIRLPNIECEQVFFRNSLDSSDTIYIGGSNVSSVEGMPFAIREFSPWIPINNLDLLYAIADAADCYLQYFIIR